MAYAAKYSGEQKEAVASAQVDRGLTAPRVAELAASGGLPGTKGNLEPFTIPVASVRHYARVMRKRRAGNTESELLALEPRDAIEVVRRRLLAMLDGEMTALEDQKPGSRDAERIRQLARAGREVAALPGPGDPRPPKPGARVNGERNGAETKPGSGLGGRIIADVMGEPPRNAETDTQDNGESQGRSAASTAQAPTDGQMGSAPGSLAPALAELSSLSG